MLGNTRCRQKNVVCFDTNHYRNIFLKKVADVNGGRNSLLFNPVFYFQWWTSNL